MTPDLILKVLKQYGFPTLVAIALGFYVMHLDAQATRERETNHKFLWEQINDLQIDLHSMKLTCVERVAAAENRVP